MIFPCILGDKKGIRPKKKPVPIIPRGAKNSQKKIHKIMVALMEKLEKSCKNHGIQYS